MTECLRTVIVFLLTSMERSARFTTLGHIQNGDRPFVEEEVGREGGFKQINFLQANWHEE